MKRLTAVLAALALTLALFPTLALAATSGGLFFTDVKPTDWYYNAVRDVYDRGYMNGTGADRFSPKATTNRATVVTILYRMAGSPEGDASSFPDVPANAWYSKAVAWAARYGIVFGYENGNFGPNDPVTREQMAMIFNRYASYLGVNRGTVDLDLSAFVDGQTVSASAEAAMCWAAQRGVITGKEGNRLDPKGLSSRAETATVLSRFVTQMAKGQL